MQDTTITLVGFTHVPIIGNDMRIIRATRVSILVGSFGPFTHDFTPPNDTQEDINAWKMQMAHTVQGVGG